jgi:hypothetical protein
MDGAGARRQSQESGLSRQVQSVSGRPVRTCFTLVGKWVEGGKVERWMDGHQRNTEGSNGDAGFPLLEL